MKLTPTQHALIQTFLSLIVSAVLVSILTIAPAFSGFTPINWQEVGIAFLISFGLSLAMGVLEYYKQQAQAQPTSPSQVQSVDLANAVEMIISSLAHRAAALSPLLQANSALPNTTASPAPVPSAVPAFTYTTPVDSEATSPAVPVVKS